MVRAGSFAALMCIFTLLSACGQLYPPGKYPPGQVGSSTRSASSHHTVRKGDTLYSIAWRYGHDHHAVARWNNIRSPYRIYAGQRIRLFPSPGSKAPQQAKVQKKLKKSGPVADRKLQVASQPIKPTKRSTGKVAWRWPTAGKVAKTFSVSKGRKGVDIKGQAGQSIRAAAGGSVVYRGDGLIGYGKLVIIKHNDIYLSAYAHNRKLLVKEGDIVKAGQKIAEMGQTGKSGSILHFEIRRNGKPENPLRHLPKVN